MTTIPTADQLFIRATQFPIIICRRCEYAVRPKQVLYHLTHSPHRIPIVQARQVAQTIQHWENIEENPDEIRYPTWIDQPIEGLRTYDDGLLCKRGQCGYVCRNVNGLKNHWRSAHDWSAYSHVGQPTPSELEAGEQAIATACERVVCQRLFARGFGSHYMHVRQPGPDYEPAPPPPRADVVDELIQQLEQRYVDSQPRRQTIRAGPLDEANPWLRRTQWATYLQVTPDEDLPHLLASIKTPPEDAQGQEGAMRAIWEAMDGVARMSQRITKQTGQMIRIEAARTEKDKSPHEPLQAYMDEEQIQRHVEPWQQILMFFARTQVEHDWQSPPYRFTPRQRRAWQALWRYAQDTRGSPDPFDSQRQGQHQGQDQDQDQDQDQGQHHGQHHGQRQGQRQGPGQHQGQEDGSDDAYQMTAIQAACMDFCIELLNQRISAEEYECALVCALAVLGRGRDRWRDAESYPPILSKMIKISRFMVLHKALRLDPNADQILQYMRDRHEVGK
jgi:hypothetical protein